jgi:hypothetical protein
MSAAKRNTEAVQYIVSNTEDPDPLHILAIILLVILGLFIVYLLASYGIKYYQKGLDVAKSNPIRSTSTAARARAELNADIKQ